jgi:cytochrome b
MNQETARTILVWDLPVRILHWLIVICVGVSWWAAEERVMDVHRYSGYTLLAILIVRIYWGFVGSQTARFGAFVRGPSAIAAYLRSSPVPAPPGHNPLGGWSVVLMLLLLLTQVGLGLFVTDVDGLESGPLSYLVSFDTSRTLAEIHEIIFNVLLALIALHIAAVLFYLFAKRTNLISAMFTGRRPAQAVTTSVQMASLWRLLPGIAIAAAIVWYVARE